MFKALGNLIHRTPWWALVGGGFTLLLALALFSVPIQVIRLHGSGATPQEQRAIEREINLAFGDRALDFAENVVRAMRERTAEGGRQKELDHALAEIARAKKELYAAKSDMDRAVRESANETASAALDGAVDAAETALEAAVEAREAIEEARRDAVALLRERGLDVTAASQSFDGMLKTAVDNEKTARETLESMRAMRQKQSLPSATPPASSASTPATGGPRAIVPPSGKFGGIFIPSVVAMTPLPEDFRGEIRKKVDRDVWRVGVGSALILAFIPLFVILLISKYFLGRSRRAQAVAEAKTQEAEVSHMSRQITEARLQALQAQIEPHFLYNTLANVQALTEVDAQAANRMVGHLIAYLRASLPKMRENTSTVGQELELVRSYLNILQMRMGARLQFSISAPPEVLGKSFPPMMLPSLVENAIKHGLEPLREGGSIDVVVEQVAGAPGERIVVLVKDTGKGLSDTATQSSGGVGLTNIRERLAAIYGGSAKFSIASNEPRGVVATIYLPTEASSALGVSLAGSNALPEAKAPPLQSGWSRAKRLTSKSHSVWAGVVARTMMVLLVGLCIVFLIALLGLYAGWMPVQIGDFQLDGLEGMALGSVGLLFGFGAVALVILILVAVLYGLGFLFAALLVFIPLAVLMSLVPALSPFIVIGLIIYWLFRRDRKRRH
jgi:hypothetical protein